FLGAVMIEIIAEIGVNHNGSFNTACVLVESAIEAGCTAVKTQLWDTERVYPRERWDEMKKLELSRVEIAKLKGYCDHRGIEFICTPDEIEDAIFLADEVGVKRIKISSQDITNIPFLKEVARLNLPMIVSTGACTRQEMDDAMVACWGATSQKITPLHCVSAYPAPMWDMNMRVINYM